MVYRGRLRILVLSLSLLAWTAAARAQAASGAGILCQNATAAAETGTGVPDQLLGAISRVETGRYDAAAGGVRAWPWTINAQGVGHFYDTKEEAVAAARAFQAQGIRSIDVGCMQINLMFHPDGFASLEQAFDPDANALFAAHFLTDLFHQTGSWPHAAAAYHSQTPDLGIDYQRKGAGGLGGAGRPSGGSGWRAQQPPAHGGGTRELRRVLRRRRYGLAADGRHRGPAADEPTAGRVRAHHPQRGPGRTGTRHHGPADG